MHSCPANPALCGLAALILPACASSSPRPLTLNDDLIVPGERIGDVEIGMPLAMLTALKGTPLKTVPMPASGAASYSYDGLTVAAHDTVYWIIADDPRFRSAAGVAPGMEQIHARSASGPPDCVLARGSETVYDYGDYYFTVANETGKVTQVGVRVAVDACGES